METSCQSSYPLNSANESPPGTFKVYLSCAQRAPPASASTPVIIGIVSNVLRFIASTPSIKISIKEMQERGPACEAFENCLPRPIPEGASLTIANPGGEPPCGEAI